MRLSVIGAAGGYPSPGVATSGYLIDHDETRVWCDIGPGTVVGFPDRLDTVDAVVISHEHPDHCLDLIALFHALAYPLHPARGPLAVYAPRPVIDKVRAFVTPDQTALIDQTFSFHPIEPRSVVDIESIRVTFAEATHPVQTLAMRFTAGDHSIAYTGDTGPAGDWTSIVAEADLFLCEATFVGTREDHPYPYHLNAFEAGRIATASGVGRLVLTHIPIHWDPARSLSEAGAHFDGDLRLAEPGTSFSI